MSEQSENESMQEEQSDVVLQIIREREPVEREVVELFSPLPVDETQSILRESLYAGELDTTPSWDYVIA